MDPEAERIKREEAQLAVYLAEYSALRDEIINFQSIEHQSIAFSIAAITGLIGLIVDTQLKNTAGPVPLHHYLERPEILLAAPPFGLLGLFFAYAQIRIIQVATYLHQVLGPKVIALTGEGTMEWETHRAAMRGSADNFLADLFSGSRWLLFVWPIFLLVRDGAWRQSLGGTGRWLLHIEQWMFAGLCLLGVYCATRLPRRVTRVSLQTH